MNCEDLEKLMYLKEDELSQEEGKALQKHLKECKECRKQYQEISKFIHKGQYNNLSIDSRFLAARVTDQYKKHQDKKLESKFNPLRRQLIKALSIASVFFFVIYSIEQVNTVKKISGLEQKLASTNGTLINQKGQLLVLNHFYDLDDLKQIINPEISSLAIPGSIFSGKIQNNLNINLLSINEKKILQQELESNPIGKIILKRGFYGNLNLMDLLSDKN